jgi:carboxylesterase type B
MNIRFAAPPLGDLRWAKPAPPPKNSTIQDGSYGPQCPNTQVNGVNFLGSGSDSGLGHFIDGILNNIGDVIENAPGSEDCLFLDVYVPGHAVRNPKGTKLPVIHFFFGGGYVLGGKNFLQPVLPFYDGSGYVQQSNNSVIFVASNYRLGAFGWLGGSTMEAEGLPNAGLWDQKAALQWTKDNIGLLGGDGNQITAMGESAGASSILHHLVMDGGKMDPLFRKVVALSPAYLTFFDRRGSIEDVFQSFTKLAGCNESSVACLRAADSDTLIKANKALNMNALDGTFVIGPVPDGKTIRQSPTLEFASGNYWKDIDGAIISHVIDESTLFVDGSITTDAQFKTFLEALFPPSAMVDGLDNAVIKQYPPINSSHPRYATEGDRLRAVVRDSSFTCHPRYLSDAYSGKTWNMQYSLFPGWHATDLLATFWTKHFGSTIVGAAFEGLIPNIGGISTAYISYINSFVKTGDPNKLSAKTNDPPAIHWPHPDLSQENVTDVLDVYHDYTLVADSEMPLQDCNFWKDFIAAATINGGYVPPGSLVKSPLANNTAGASQNYTTPTGGKGT